MPKFLDNIGNFLFGSPEKRENVSTLRSEQEPLYEQLIKSGMAPGGGGAFGTAADYYRNLLSGNSDDYNAFAAPAMRQYYQDIVPGLSEQFAGMGAGGLSSSGFRNAQNQGAVDLAERLGQIRANLRQAGAQGLQNIGMAGLQNFSQNMVTEQGSPGFLAQVAPAAGNFLATYLSGQGGGNKVGANSSPYGGSASPSASPQFSVPQLRPLPNFMDR